MIARGFKSVLWVATVGGAALGCYMVSLKVATERADLGRVETQIVDTQRDIRSLKTELGTRGRLAQLEDWNANVLALSAPAASQFLPDHLTLARLEQRDETVEDRAAKVQMASLDTGAAAKPQGQTQSQPQKAPAAEPAVPAVKAPRLIHAIETAAAPTVQPSLVRQASFVTGPAQSPLRASVAPSPKPAKAAKSARLDSIADEIGAAARAERSGKAGRERSAGTR